MCLCVIIVTHVFIVKMILTLTADPQRQAKEEADRKAKEESDRKAKEEADRKSKEERDRKAKEEEHLRRRAKVVSELSTGTVFVYVFCSSFIVLTPLLCSASVRVAIVTCVDIVGATQPTTIRTSIH